MSLKKKLSMAVVTTTAGAAIMAAGSFALFSSSVTNNSNTFTASTVEVSLAGEKSSSTTKFFTVPEYLQPGDSGQGSAIEIKNEGNVAEWVKVGHVESENATGDKNIFAAQGTDNNPLDVDYVITLPGGTTINGDTTNGDSTPFKLAAGQKATIQYTYAWSKDAGNGYQKATGKLAATVSAVQSDNNTNGNGPIAWN